MSSTKGMQASDQRRTRWLQVSFGMLQVGGATRAYIDQLETGARYYIYLIWQVAPSKPPPSPPLSSRHSATDIPFHCWLPVLPVVPQPSPAAPRTPRSRAHPY